LAQDKILRNELMDEIEILRRKTWEAEGPKKSSMAQAMRQVINTSKARIIETETAAKVINKESENFAPRTDNSTINNSDIKNALNHLRAPRPRPHQQLNGTVDLSSEALAPVQKSTVKEADKISARIDSKYRKFLESFKPLTIQGAKAPGLGKTIQYLIEDYSVLLNDQKEHIKEVQDFLRQVQNAENEYLKYFQTSSPEELEAKKKFQDSINTLRLVLNLKKLSDHRLMQFMDKGLLPKSSYQEIHYYLNFQVYEKWEERGV
jgi:hypothetical protein